MKSQALYAGQTGVHVSKTAFLSSGFRKDHKDHYACQLFEKWRIFASIRNGISYWHGACLLHGVCSIYGSSFQMRLEAFISRFFMVRRKPLRRSESVL
jgi:hypothetical protein